MFIWLKFVQSTGMNFVLFVSTFGFSCLEADDILYMIYEILAV